MFPVGKGAFRHSFMMRTKPKAYNRNLLGNTEVNHLQLHGQLYELPDVGVTLTSQRRVTNERSYPIFNVRYRNSAGNWTSSDFTGFLTPDTPVTIDSLDYSDYSTYRIIYGGGKYPFVIQLNVLASDYRRSIFVSIQYACLRATDGSNRYWTEYATTFNGSLPQQEIFGKTFEAWIPEFKNWYPCASRYFSYSGWDYSQAKALIQVFADNYANALAELGQHPIFDNRLFYDRYEIQMPWSVSINGPDIQKLFRLRYELLRTGEALEPTVDLRIVLGDAVQSAANSALQFTGNAIPLVKEILQLKETLLDLYHLLQGEVSIDSLANLWLSARYGIRLTLSDLTDLISSIKKQLREAKSPRRPISACRGGASTDLVEAHAKLYYDTVNHNVLARAINWLMVWDIFPTLTNAWDLVPYSFVVDWLVDVEGFLEAFDTRTLLSTMKIFSSCITTKYTWSSQSAKLHGYVGNVSWTRYIRSCPSEPPQPVPSFSGSLPSMQNIVDGTALIIQRLH